MVGNRGEPVCIITRFSRLQGGFRRHCRAFERFGIIFSVGERATCLRQFDGFFAFVGYSGGNGIGFAEYHFPIRFKRHGKLTLVDRFYFVTAHDKHLRSGIEVDFEVQVRPFLAEYFGGELQGIVSPLLCSGRCDLSYFDCRLVEYVCHDAEAGGKPGREE